MGDGLDAANAAPWLSGLINDGIVAGVGAVLGFKLRPVATLLAAGLVREALEADPRVEKVENLSGQHDGDTARFGATVKAVREAQSLALNLVFPVDP